MSLRELQTWFVESTTVNRGKGIERRLTAGPLMTAEERLGIYQHGYKARLVECLADDYPALKHALGEEPFEAMCHAYIEAHPSQSPSLNFFGREMSAFCVDPFLSQLAALEWAMVETLHAPPAPVLSLDELSRVDPERWPGAVLTPSETLRLLRFEYPVNAYLQAFKDDEAPSIPRPSPTAVAVYRQGWTIWRMDLTPPMASLLEALFAGSTLGDALESVSGLGTDVTVWFRDWVAGGFFGGIRYQTMQPDAH
jgi:hypothetical protein